MLVSSARSTLWVLPFPRLFYSKTLDPNGLGCESKRPFLPISSPPQPQPRPRPHPQPRRRQRLHPPQHGWRGRPPRRPRAAPVAGGAADRQVRRDRVRPRRHHPAQRRSGLQAGAPVRAWAAAVWQRLPAAGDAPLAAAATCSRIKHWRFRVGHRHWSDSDLSSRPFDFSL